MSKIETAGSSSAQKEGLNNEVPEAFAELERAVHVALETYSNVHRGSGHFSIVTTHLYEKAREIVLDFLDLDKNRFVVIFCTPRREQILRALLSPGSFKSISSKEIGLALGVRALAVDRKSLPRGNPFQSGGGTTKLVSGKWVIWAGAPERFEAGTPAVINIIAFAKALLQIKTSGNEVFRNIASKQVSFSEILYSEEQDLMSGPDVIDELRKTLIGRNVLVPTADGLSPYINLDNAASTPAFEPVWTAFCQALKQPGKVQHEIVGEVRKICHEVLGASPDEYKVIFTSNTTEAINLAAEGLERELRDQSEPVVLNTLLEHNSNDLPWRTVEGYTHIRMDIDAEGFVDTNKLKAILSAYNKEYKYGAKRIKLVAISGASNVLGSFNDLKEICGIVHQYGARLLVDAAQVIAHRKMDMNETGIDYLAFCAHKVYAPFGSGALIVRKSILNFDPDEIEQIRLSGEENIAGIAALGKALAILSRIGLDMIRQEEQALTRKVLIGMAKIPGLKIFGIKDPDSPRFDKKGGVIPFFLKKKMPYRVARELAEQGGIGIRYGCHCAHLLVKSLLNVPPFLEEFQKIIALLFPKIVFPGVARVSLGIGNTGEDIDELLKKLHEIADSSRKHRSDKSISGQNGGQLISRKELKQQINDFVNATARKVYYQSV